MSPPVVSDTDKPLPLSFRGTLASSVMSCIDAGESCSLIGVASVGKSNLLHFLVRPDVRHHYLGANWERFLFVIIDRNKLAEVSAWGMYELFLHGLLEALDMIRGSEACNESRTLFEDQYEKVVTSRDNLLAQRYLSRWVRTLTELSNHRFVFLLDDFDDVLSELDQGVFLNLRALRDEHKYCVSYIVLTRRLLPILRSDMETTLESFYELLSHSVFPLRPYNHADARTMIERLMARRQVRFSEATIEHLVWTSGGHSGLLRAGFEFACSTPSGQVESAARRMAEVYGVGLECRKIWDSLTERERQLLSRAVVRQPWPRSDDTVAQHLKVKGLLNPAEEGKKSLFSPVFAEWVLRNSAI